MKRRKFVLGVGAAAASGASLLGSGAFTSVEADRSIDVDVVGDGEAFLRLAPCTVDGEEQPNGAYVRETPEGTIAIDLSESNDQVAGDGVNAEALSVFHNVFEICNQGTQDLCVDFTVDVPEIPGPVPNRYDFESGDPAVVFYRGSNREEFINTEGLNVDRPGAISLNIEDGECECVGLEVRAFGFEAGTELFADAELTIRADADGNCEDGVADPGPGYSCGVYADAVVDSEQGTTAGDGSIAAEQSDPTSALGQENAGSYPTDASYDTSEVFSLGFGEGDRGYVELSFPGQVVRNDDGADIVVYEATNGDRMTYGLEQAEVYVVDANGNEHSIGTATSRSEDESTNSGTSELTIDSSLVGPFEAIKLVDRSDRSEFPDGANGFDVDAVEVCVNADTE